ncbi:hemolysin E [Escherichia coli]|nr:hemolysin E [Escherichia coli]EEZ6260541.1 hemolysin E [Escherichia coli]EFA7630880.1 hemolysin E [Escherichia coli]EFB2862235.1 hemolysin E [Escherichia coli]EFB3381873.1 hemolysin E [Escherichia coli]
MFDIYHINRNKDIDASRPANYELDEVKFINSCKTGVSLQFIYLKRRMIMTEIVADKTVEVVKNAIETADGALDLYNKYLDQVIPWQTFDETIKELSRFKQEYSQAASVLVGDIKTLLMDSRISILKQPKQCMNGVVLRRNCSQRIFFYLMSTMRRKHPPRKTFSLRYWMTASRS